MKPGLQRALKICGISFAVLLALIVLAVALIDLDVFRHPIERVASARSGRTVTIGGRLQAHLWSWTPGITFNQLSIGNPPWEAGPPMLSTQQLVLQVHLLPLLHGQVVIERLELRQPQVFLHRDAKGQANWTFETQQPSAAPAGAPTRLPLIRYLAIEDGQLTVRDEILHLNVKAHVQASEKQGKEDPHAFRFEGKGSVNQQPLTVEANGGPLIAVDAQRPYPFALRIQAGDVHIDSDGVLRKPFDLGQIGLVVRASGDDLADFYYLTQLALPNTPPFKLQASLERNGNEISIDPLAGKVGESDLHGRLHLDLSHKRPLLTGELASAQLRLADLAASLGGKNAGSVADANSAKPTLAKAEKATAQRPHAPPATVAPDKRLFPDARLQVNRVRAMDADVRFSAKSIEVPDVDMKQVALHIQLHDGVLALEPFEFVLPQGRLQGTLSIDARNKIPETHLDMRISDIELAQLGSKKAGAVPPLAGDVQARILLQGAGDSVHDFVADSSGKVTFVLPHGEVNAAFAELTGIDVANGLGLLLKGSQQRVPVRCGVAQFGVDAGVMHVQNVVVDTQNVIITGSGEIRLGPEELNMSLKGAPKKPRIGRLYSPIKVGGHLLKPAVGVSVGATVKQGVIAAALGALITPLAAVIAFVDPGLAKNADCAALLASAQSGPAPPPPPKSAATPAATPHS